MKTRHAPLDHPGCCLITATVARPRPGGHTCILLVALLLWLVAATCAAAEPIAWPTPQARGMTVASWSAPAASVDAPELDMPTSACRSAATAPTVVSRSTVRTPARWCWPWIARAR